MKEVEIKNTIEVQNGVNTDYNILDGYLIEDGTILMLKVATSLLPDQHRFVWLDKVTVDNKGNTLSYLRLFESMISFLESFDDIEIPLTSLVPVEGTTDVEEVEPGTGVTTFTVNVDTYTYEANVTTEYGSKRLSVPYSMTVDKGLYTDNSSTDGWYQVGVIDIPNWKPEITFRSGELVYREGTMYLAIRDSLESDPLEVGGSVNWESFSTSKLYDYMSMVSTGTENDASLKVFSDLMITRRVKYTILYDILRAVDFDAFDNKDAATAAVRIHALRDAIKMYLNDREPIKAIQTLYKVEAEYAKFKWTSTQDNYPEQTLTSNNFTL